MVNLISVKIILLILPCALHAMSYISIHKLLSSEKSMATHCCITYFMFMKTNTVFQMQRRVHDPEVKMKSLVKPIIRYFLSVWSKAKSLFGCLPLQLNQHCTCNRKSNIKSIVDLIYASGVQCTVIYKKIHLYTKHLLVFEMSQTNQIV